MGEKLIMFSWQNFYLTGVQAGIQSGHCWMDMAVKYFGKGGRADDLKEHGKTCMFWDWAEHHKVVNIRNGGEQNTLRDIITLFEREDNPYPWASFREDECLNMALTNVSIVLPQKVFAHEPVEVEEGEEYPLTPFEAAVYNLIKRTRLAI